MKTWIKKYKISTTIYLKILELMYKSSIIPNEIPTKIFYKSSTGKRLDLNNPKDFNQKLQWIKLYYTNDLYSKCADKLMVREYIKDKGFDFILNDLLFVFENVEEIDFSKLPNQFVIKGTKNGHIICSDKKSLNIEESLNRFKKELDKDFGISTGELHYKDIKKRIIVEKYLGDQDGVLPLDYKIYAFHGEPYCICVYERNPVDFSTIRYFYDFNWKPLDNFITEKFASESNKYTRPKNLNEMYQIAKVLSEDFPFVRVDLYNIENRIVFGELTFTPTSGIGKAYSQEALKILGDKLKLPI